MNRERVIFRREYNRETKQDGFIACYPDEEAKVGRILALPFHFIDKDMYSVICECHGEISLDYFYSQKIIHKNDPIIPKLIRALERLYGGKYEAIEKITRRRSR